MQNWTNFIWLFLVIGAPAISWSLGKLREQYEKKRLRDLQRSRETESLRVQHVTDRTEQPDAEAERAQRLAELAARRQAQLEQLRQRRVQMGVQTPVVQAPAPPARTPQRPMRPGVPAAPRPGTPSAPVRRPAAQVPPQTRPTPAQPARPRPVVRPPQVRSIERPDIAQVIAPLMAAKAAPARPMPRASDVAVVSRDISGIGADIRATLARASAGSSRHLATALVLADILDRPVSMRSMQPGDMAEF